MAQLPAGIHADAGSALRQIMIATVMAVQPSMPQTDRTRSGDEFTFRPQAADTLTMAVIGLERMAGGISTVRFNPQYGQVPGSPCCRLKRS